MEAMDCEFGGDRLSQAVTASDEGPKPLQLDVAPLKGLLMALLEDAVRCVQKNAVARSQRGKRLLAEANEWINDELDQGPFAFNSVCEILKIDPAYLRSGLKKWCRERSLDTSPHIIRRTPVIRAGRVGRRSKALKRYTY